MLNNNNSRRARNAVAQSVEHFVSKRQDAERTCELAQTYAEWQRGFDAMCRFDALAGAGFDTYCAMLLRA